MSLFQPSVLKKYLSQQDTDQVQKAYKKYSKYFHNAAIQENIRNSKEEQFQEGFLRELFVDILGYTLNPTPKFNLTTELKNIKGSKKVDGAILKDGNALAVIELKGTNTKDMESIRQQAFDYKANQTGCIYVITSNFEKLRFYINNAVDFEEFNLFTLSHSEFEIFYLCLAKDNILTNKPLSIKEASVVEEENITKKFYADYSLFKRELYRDLVKQNRNNIMLTELSEKTSKLTLFKKSQKLIDRFLFILFAEDRGLLAPNSINTILKEWKALADLDMDVPLYDRYKQYFRYLDTGRKGTDKKEEIFAYNGGLFQPDTILDAVVIDSELLYRHTKKLSTYDFESQVDVNILGHIFEHSLNEIESVNAEIEGTDFDKQKTKRKKDGVFYTPKYITKYIVDNTVGKLCTEKKQELGILDEDYAKGRKNRQATTIIKLEQQLKEYREWLLELTICDPACGSGAFLNQALDFLIREHAYIDELTKQLFGGGFAFPDIENQILEHNIYGVDLNEESIEIAKLSLWLRTAQPKRKLTSLNNNIKCGNSLIDSKAIANDKAFNWKDEFPEVFAKGGFDVIIGNPPYVFARDNFRQEEKDFFVSKYVSAKYQINTYLLFIEKSVHLIKNNGIYGLIIPNSWLMMYSGEGLRKFLLETNKINQIINLAGFSFETANVETVILLAEKESSKKENTVQILLNNGNEFYLSHTKKQTEFSKNEGFEFKVFLDEESDDLNLKIIKDSEILDSLVKIKAGLQAYEKDKGEPKQSAEDVINRPYDYDYKFDDNTHKYLDGKDVGRYFTSWAGSYLRYGKHLAAPRTFNLFDGKKIIVREITGNYPKCLIATYDEVVYLYNRSNIAIVEKANSNISLKYILAVLNSKLLSYYFVKNTAKSVRKLFPKIILNDLRKFPIKKINPDSQIPFIENTDKILTLYKDLQAVNRKFGNYFSGQYKLEKLPKKLENWNELTFADFITELNKAIKTSGQTPLSKKDEFEWLDLFEENKTKAQTLKSQIETTEKAIDKMVYELYGLSEEEISIIENN
ncbi:Eco57I restriction-modification methylase domain-containing protein [Flavobacterium urumqiense]|uniref:site-specific DNA-methyltransferase (adenine-specific) n=1 Tax=Flavobacterium urumqiense TaxID=935224 RepID=A0A1H5V892_9FLAO|nr:N-6 DNA methylase [Flavobacterium urumqiense]SEF82667.1 N-6 DNA Methylase [Flavobacterium urumqiense]